MNLLNLQRPKRVMQACCAFLLQINVGGTFSSPSFLRTDSLTSTQSHVSAAKARQASKATEAAVSDCVSFTFK